MRYDSIFSPEICYHIEFQWMVATGCSIEEFVHTTIRKAKTCGLTMIQIPVERFKDNLNPFHRPVFIPLKIDDLIETLGRQSVISLILKKNWNFNIHFLFEKIEKQKKNIFIKQELLIYVF